MQRLGVISKLVSRGFSSKKWKWEHIRRSGNVWTETKRPVERRVILLQVKIGSVTAKFKKIKLFKYVAFILSLLRLGFR